MGLKVEVELEVEESVDVQPEDSLFADCSPAARGAFTSGSATEGGLAGTTGLGET